MRACVLYAYFDHARVFFVARACRFKNTNFLASSSCYLWYLLVRVCYVFGMKTYDITSHNAYCDPTARSQRLVRPHRHTQRLPQAAGRRALPPTPTAAGPSWPPAASWCVGPVRGEGVQRRSAAPATAASARVGSLEVRHGRQHTGAIIGARPRAALAVEIPPKHRVCPHPHTRCCSERG